MSQLPTFKLLICSQKSTEEMESRKIGEKERGMVIAITESAAACNVT